MKINHSFQINYLKLKNDFPLPPPTHTLEMSVDRGRVERSGNDNS